MAGAGTSVSNAGSKKVSGGGGDGVPKVIGSSSSDSYGRGAGAGDGGAAPADGSSGADGGAAPLGGSAARSVASRRQRGPCSPITMSSSSSQAAVAEDGRSSGAFASSRS